MGQKTAPTKRAWVHVVASLLTAALLMPAAPAWGAELPIPELTLWEAHMLTYGQSNCYLGSLDHVYYDAERVYYQIADYTGDATWNTCAQLAEQVYRDQFVLPNNGFVQGYWNFTTGLTMDYLRTGDGTSKNAAILLSKNAAFARDGTPLGDTRSADLSREVAYAILSYINAQALGEPKRQRRIDLVNQAYDHMDQWFVRFAWPGPWQQSPQETARLAPFMVSLTAHSLIRDWEETKDPRLIPALRRAADWMWANAWVPSAESMWYESLDTTARAPDLNLLIAPIYAFLYRQTGETKYRDQGDPLFAGGTRRAFLANGKQFDQNYWWSFDYVKWRSGSDPAPAGGPVGYWALDDGSGALATDGSGNGRSGTLVNGPTWTAGKLGLALAFDGLDDYVEVPHAPALNAYPLTVAVWIKTTSASGVRGIVNKYVAASSNGWNLFLNSGNLCAWYLRDTSNYVYDGAGCTFNLPGYNNGQWHHVAYVVDAAGGRLYVDGALQANLGWTGSPGAPSTTQPLRIGDYPGVSGGAAYFPGLLDDVRIYDRALTAAEVLGLTSETILQRPASPTNLQIR